MACDPPAPPPHRPITPAPSHAEDATPAPAAADEQPGVAVEIPETDPLFAYLQSAPGPVDLARLDSSRPPSTTARGRRGARRPARDPGRADRDPQSGPATLRAGVLLGRSPAPRDPRGAGRPRHPGRPAGPRAGRTRPRSGSASPRSCEIAPLIQQQFLPHELPNLPEWQVAAYYGPARAVGGDFYDFIELADGRIGIVVGDVTDKGVPAALVMARTHSSSGPRRPGCLTRRGPRAGQRPARRPRCRRRCSSPACTWSSTRDRSGAFANAGHNLPYVRTDDGVVEIRATGMPLGLMPGIRYEENEADIGPGDSVLLYSDGLIEAHDPAGEMYGFPRLNGDMASELAGSELLDELLERLHAFTGRGWEQEDDITIVALRRSAGSGRRHDAGPTEDSDPARRRDRGPRRVRAPRRVRQRARRDGAGRRGRRPGGPARRPASSASRPRSARPR